MSLIFLLFWTIIPNSTALVSMLFISKVHVLFMLIVLLSRIIIAGEQQHRGASANHQNKSGSSGSTGHNSCASSTFSRAAEVVTSKVKQVRPEGPRGVVEGGLGGRGVGEGYEELAGSSNRLVTSSHTH